MKLNAKVYNGLTSEPAVVQESENKRIEIHFMNDTPFFNQYANKGKLSVWSANGTTYKLLIEKGYYESVPEIYTASANEIWTSYLGLLVSMQRKFNYIFLGVSLAIIAIGLGISIPLENTWIGFGAVVIVLILSMVQNTFLRKRVNAENEKLQISIRDLVGDQRFNEVVERQQKYYNDFYKVPEPAAEENKDNEIEQLEGNEPIDAEINEENSDSNE